MKMWQSLVGRRRLEITCADTSRFLNALIGVGITAMNVEHRNELILHLTVSHKDYKALLTVADKQGASVKKLQRSGAYWAIPALKKRPVLLVLAAVLIGLFCYLPSRIFFVDVEGNISVPTNQIIEAAGECGIGFGASRRQIRSEKMKNALLQKIPQLQWAGINTSGCTAVISVKEKSEPEHNTNTENQVSSIVALRDGIIKNCTVFQGNPLCTVGQAVKAGQTLVSGYTDCGIYIQATRANAEIRALTSRELEVITPEPAYVRGALKATKTVYSLRIGKKLIKLTKDSGILGTTCAKIYSEEYVRLPGEFCLPIALVKQTICTYENLSSTQTASDDNGWLYSYAQAHLQRAMIAGEIVSAQADVSALDGASYLYGRYACIEMIGQVKYEQTILKDGHND